MALKAAQKALEEERFEDAIEILKRILLDENNEPEVLVYLGIAYVQTEQPAKAVEVLRQAEDEVEDHCILCLFLGRALKALGELADAEDCLRRAINQEPERPEAWEDLANVLFEQKEYGKTVRILSEGVTRFPNNVSLRGLNAICYHRLGDYTSAEIEWRTVVKQRPDSVMAWSNIAYMMILQTRYEEASTIIDKIRELDSSDYRFQLLKGEMVFQDRDFENAIPYYDRVIEQNPNNIQALSRLALVYNELSNSEASIAYLNRAEKSMHTNPQCWRGLSDTYERLGMKEKVIEILVYGTEIDKGSAAPWISLAQEYTRIGKTEEAMHAWKMSFELREYVKICCTSCDSYFKIPYTQGLRFDLNRNQICPTCAEEVRIPDGLALI